MLYCFTVGQQSLTSRPTKGSVSPPTLSCIRSEEGLHCPDRRHAPDGDALAALRDARCTGGSSGRRARRCPGRLDRHARPGAERLRGPGITPNDSKAKRFVSGVSVADITEHQFALQQIASLNDDTREVFSPGYQESLDYVVSTLKAAGYDPQVNQFNFPVWRSRSRRS